MAKTPKRFKADHNYKIGFGVKQAEKIEKAANTVNETPKTFIKQAALDAANKLNDSSAVAAK